MERRGGGRGRGRGRRGEKVIGWDERDRYCSDSVEKPAERSQRLHTEKITNWKHSFRSATQTSLTTKRRMIIIDNYDRKGNAKKRTRSGIFGWLATRYVESQSHHLLFQKTTKSFSWSSPWRMHSLTNRFSFYIVFFYVYIAVSCLGCLGEGLFAGSLHIALLCPMEKRSIISPHPNPPECRQSTLFLMFDVHTSVTLWVETEARGGDQYWLELVLSGPANLRTIVRGHTIVASDTQLRVC